MSVDTHTRAWLQRPSSARVLHVFHEACNLQSAEGTVYALVSERIGDGPNRAVLPVYALDDRIAAGRRVQVQRGQILLDSVSVDVTAAREWNARFAWESL